MVYYVKVAMVKRTNEIEDKGYRSKISFC